MIRLDPIPETDFNCPDCERDLDTKDYHIPGMRVLAKLYCPRCNQEYYGDLPVGHGLVYPALLDPDEGKSYSKYGGDWYGQWLENSFKNRSSEPVSINKETNTPVKNPILLNCLDALYGHSLLKLLNSQYHLDSESEHELFVIVPSNLKWLVPEGVGEVWSVDIPLSEGNNWNDWIASEIRSFLDSFKSVWVSHAFSHPHPDDYDVHRFTGVQPFYLDNRPNGQQTVTYIWRDDRLWESTRHTQGVLNRIQGRFYSIAEKLGLNPAIYEQRRKVVRLHNMLQSSNSNLDFAVAGYGEPGGLPDSIDDLRTTSLNNETEYDLCQQYAQSNVVVGVHGSNMLLPSGHAGSVVELVPPNRWGNMTQDLLFNNKKDVRQAVFDYRHIPVSSSPKQVGRVINSILKHRQQQSLHMSKEFTSQSFIEPYNLKYKWQARSPEDGD